MVGKSGGRIKGEAICSGAGRAQTCTEGCHLTAGLWEPTRGSRRCSQPWGHEKGAWLSGCWQPEPPQAWTPTAGRHRESPSPEALPPGSVSPGTSKHDAPGGREFLQVSLRGGNPGPVPLGLGGAWGGPVSSSLCEPPCAPHSREGLADTTAWGHASCLSFPSSQLHPGIQPTPRLLGPCSLTIGPNTALRS